MKQNTPFQNSAVEKVFATYPEPAKTRLLTVRELIFELAKTTPTIGLLTETLKWNEPSYLTEETNSGSTIRIAWKKTRPNNYNIYFNCKTTLVSTFKEIYGNLITTEGNRCLTLDTNQPMPSDIITDCLNMALTYHLNKKRKL